MDPIHYLHLADQFDDLMYEATEPRHRLALAVQWFNERPIEELLHLFGEKNESA